MPMPSTAEARLLQLSCANQIFDPIDWPEEREPHAFYFAPDLMSIAGTDIYASLDEPTRQRLSLYEAANFFSINVHGERHLIAGLAARLHVAGYEPHSDYLHHFLAEENRHAAMFAKFCHRYAGKMYPDLAPAMIGDEEAETDLLFFARIAVFEEIVDTFNRAMARDRHLAPVARAINRIHHLDEARHLAFGHQLLRDLVAARRDTWTGQHRVNVAKRLASFADRTWRSLFNPAVYTDAGLSNPFDLRRVAMASDAAHQRRDWALRGCRRLLARLDLAMEGSA